MEFDRNFDVTPGEVEQVSSLVRRVLCDNPGPFTFKGTSTFIVGRGRVAVIDPGPGDEPHLNALLAALRGETVSHILVSHSHADHSSLAPHLSKAAGARIYAYGSIQGLGDSEVRLDHGIDHAFSPDERLRDGDVVTGPGWTLQALHTPGHMSNHLCFALREESVLFTGDHVMAWSTSIVAPPDGNMGDYMKSLERLLPREDRLYLPSHGPARADPLSLVKDLIAHRRMREAAILESVKEGHASLEKITGKVYQGIDPPLIPAAMLSAKAHLDHLIAQGLIREMFGRYELRSEKP